MDNDDFINLDEALSAFFGKRAHCGGRVVKRASNLLRKHAAIRDVYAGQIVKFKRYAWRKRICVIAIVGITSLNAA